MAHPCLMRICCKGLAALLLAVMLAACAGSSGSPKTPGPSPARLSSPDESLLFWRIRVLDRTRALGGFAVWADVSFGIEAEPVLREARAYGKWSTVANKALFDGLLAMRGRPGQYFHRKIRLIPGLARKDSKTYVISTSYTVVVDSKQMVYAGSIFVEITKKTQFEEGASLALDKKYLVGREIEKREALLDVVTRFHRHYPMFLPRYGWKLLARTWAPEDSHDLALTRMVIRFTCDPASKQGCARIWERGGPRIPSLANLKPSKPLVLLVCERGHLDSCRTACNQNFGEGCLAYARGLHTGKGVAADPKEAVAYYKKACRLNIPSGCNWAGMCHTRGTGVPRDHVQGTTLFNSACLSNHAVGCFNLAINYYLGQGVVKSFERAAELFGKACNLKEWDSCNRLAVMYASGRGVAKDPKRAFELYSKACSKGWTMACSNLALVYLKGEGTSLDQGKARFFFGRACARKNAFSCNRLGLLWERGQGGAVDLAKAADLYEKACKLGNAWGCHNQGYCLEKGRGVVKNMLMAAAFYEKACNLGNAEGCYKLALLYKVGSAVKKDKRKARELFEKACRLNHEKACKALGRKKGAAPRQRPSPKARKGSS